MTVPETILSQLGGRRFAVMTGCNHFSQMGNSLYMNIPRNKSKANRLRINLAPDDTYTMMFTRYTSFRVCHKTGQFYPEKTTDVAIYAGIYCDQLQEIFTEVTGMYTHL